MENIQDLKIKITKQKEKIDELSNNLWSLTSELARIEAILEQKEAELKEITIRHLALTEDYEDKLKELEFYKTW